MKSPRTRSAHQLVGTGVAALALVALGACGLGSDPPAQDIGGVQATRPTPAEGFVDEPRVHRHGAVPVAPGPGAARCAPILRRSVPSARCVP
jgi:hypothetical protein